MSLSLPLFTRLVDLASERVGGKVLETNDDFFAEKENLIKPGRGVFIPDRYTDRGKWMDGWESRRRRTPGHDWCVLQLGIPGIIRGVDIDTNHFLGNHPPHASIEARVRTPSGLSDWKEILKKSPLNPGSQNFYEIRCNETVEELRLNIYPDGGVARLKVYGEARPDPKTLATNENVDLISIKTGGLVLHCNDMFFGPKDNLILPGKGINMGDGWETKRKREPGHDWVLIRMGTKGTLSSVLVDTWHFKGNFPDRCSLEGVCIDNFVPDMNLDSEIEKLQSPSTQWTSVLPETKLQAHQEHLFESQLKHTGPFTHLRFNIFPDGGVSRLRVWGQPA